jgi:histone H3/H4
MAELPGAAVKRLVIKHGGELRISGSALKAAVAAAEDYIGRLARAAASSAQESKRKTIMDADIEKARQTTGG